MEQKKEGAIEKVKKRKRGRPTEKSSANKEQILKVALKAFAINGFGGVTISKISRIANVDDSLLHYHFGNKESLWRNAVQMAFNEYLIENKKTAKLFRDLELISLSKAMTRHFIQFNGRNPELFQIIIHEMALKSSRSDWLQKEVLGPLSQIFLDHQTDQIKQGLVDKIPLHNLTTIFLGACNTFFLLHHQMKDQFGIDAFDEKAIDQHADMVIKIFYDGCSKK